MILENKHLLGPIFYYQGSLPHTLKTSAVDRLPRTEAIRATDSMG